MATTDPSSARGEAERLVATALAALRLAGAGRPGGFGPLGDLISGVLDHTLGARPGPSPGPAGDGGFATGAAECTVCPICRVMAVLRDPSPEVAERLATGAGDFAAGLASLLRAFASVTATEPAAHPSHAGSSHTGSSHTGSSHAGPTHAEPSHAEPSPPDPGPTTGTPAGPADFASVVSPGPAPARGADGGQVWREAGGTGHDSWPVPEGDVWAAATRAAAGPRPEPAGSTPVVPAARTPEEPARADGDTGDGDPGDGA